MASASIDVKAVNAEVKVWLRQFGWPEIPDADGFVLNNLEPIFHHLAMKGLVKMEMFEGFMMGAHMAYTKKQGY